MIRPENGGFGIRAFLRAALPLGLLMCGSQSSAEPLPPFAALIHDGRVVVGQQLGGDTSYLGPTFPAGTIRIDATRLVDPGQPRRIRSLVATQRRFQPKPPYVMMTNGDILPGEIVGFRPENAERKRPAALLLAPAHPFYAIDGQAILIRPECLWAFCRRVDLPPVITAGTGRVRTLDGRVAQAGRIRFVEDALLSLTPEGLTRRNLREVDQLIIGDAGILDGLLWDAVSLAKTTDPAACIERLWLPAARVSFPRTLVSPGRLDKTTNRWETAPPQGGQIGGLSIIPMWSRQRLGLAQEPWIGFAFRMPEELPAERLPIESCSQKRGFAQGPTLRVDRAPGGGPLAAGFDGAGGLAVSGPLVAAGGFGMHAESAVTLSLPLASEQFESFLGFPPEVGPGGCVDVCVYRDQQKGQPLFRRQFLRGSDGPIRIGPLDIRGARRLILTVEMAHHGRPLTADPLDIRDQVNWLSPLVRVTRESLGDDGRFERFHTEDQSQR